MTHKLFREIAICVDARLRCVEKGNHEWAVKHSTRIESLIENYLPHGSGFDNGVKINWDKSTGEKLVFTTSFHHMDDNGSYCGWTKHTVTVRASMISEFDLHISGRNKRDIKEHISDSFDISLHLVV